MDSGWKELQNTLTVFKIDLEVPARTLVFIRRIYEHDEVGMSDRSFPLVLFFQQGRNSGPCNFCMYCKNRKKGTEWAVDQSRLWETATEESDEACKKERTRRFLFFSFLHLGNGYDGSSGI